MVAKMRVIRDRRLGLLAKAMALGKPCPRAWVSIDREPEYLADAVNPSLEPVQPYAEPVDAAYEELGRKAGGKR